MKALLFPSNLQQDTAVQRKTFLIHKFITIVNNLRIISQKLIFFSVENAFWGLPDTTAMNAINCIILC